MSNNILIIYESRIATVDIVEKTIVELFSDDSTVNSKKLLHVRKADLYENDVIIFVRATDYLSRTIARFAKRLGKIVLEYIDDDLLNYKKGIFSLKWRRKYLKDSLEQADCVLSPNALLANEMKNININNRAIELKSVACVWKGYIEKKSGPIKIVYSAGSEHEIYFENNISPILNKLDEKYGNLIQFDFIGVAPSVDKNEYDMEFNYIEHMEYNKYHEYMMTTEYDIGLSPLSDSRFNKYKYYNKYLEYSSFGIPAIYSDVGPYNSVIVNRNNGILVDNNPEEWFVAISQMIDDLALRENIIKNAQEHLKTNYNSVTIRNEMINELPEILDKHSSNGKIGLFEINRALYKLQRMFEFVWQVFYYITSDEYSFIEIVRKKVKRNCFHI